MFQPNDVRSSAARGHIRPPADAPQRQVRFRYLLGPDDVGCAAGQSAHLDIYAGSTVVLENAACDDAPRTLVTPPGEQQVRIVVWSPQLWSGSTTLAADAIAVDVVLSLVPVPP